MLHPSSLRTWRLRMATSQPARAQSAAATSAASRRRFSWTPYLFILPHLIFFTAFLGYPFFYGIYISLFNFDFLRPEFRPFVGVEPRLLSALQRAPARFLRASSGSAAEWPIPRSQFLPRPVLRPLRALGDS